MKTVIRKSLVVITIAATLPLFILLGLMISFRAHASMDYTATEVIVKYKKANQTDIISGQGVGTYSTFVATLEQLHGLSLERSIPVFGIDTFSISENQSVEAVVAQLKNHPNVAYVEPNYILEVERTGHFALPMEGAAETSSFGLDNFTDDLAAYANDPILVAVVDTGIDTLHPALQGRIYQNGAEVAGNDIDDDGNGYVDDVNGWNFVMNSNDAFDDNRHGTHVAGTIAGVKGPGDVDTSGNYRLLPLKFLGADGYGTLADAVEAIAYGLSMGAKVFNNSWGGGGFSQALHDAVTQSYNSGALFLAAAGNSNSDIDENPSYPASFEHPNVLTVAAVNSFGTIASFSNFGAKGVDVAAPGVSIYSTLPTGMYGYLSGTSMATPYVARLAMLLLDQYRDLSIYQVKQALMDSAVSETTLAEVTVSGGYVNDAAATTLADSLMPDSDVPSYEPTEQAAQTPQVLPELVTPVDLASAGCGAITTGGSSGGGPSGLISLVFMVLMGLLLANVTRLQRALASF